MRISLPCRSRTRMGISLLECLVYMAILFVVVGCATAIFFRSWTDSKALHRNATDILAALHAGDQWRDDVRKAIGPVQVAETSDGEQIRIPSAQGTTYYTFSNGKISRQGAGDSIGQVWLDSVKASQMQMEKRNDISSWRWELELKSSIRTAKFHPLFTFEAVPGGRNSQ